MVSLCINKILEGIATVIVGVISSFGGFFSVLRIYTNLCVVIVDSPATAKFLLPEERSYVIHRKSRSSYP